MKMKKEEDAKKKAEGNDDDEFKPDEEGGEEFGSGKVDAYGTKIEDDKESNDSGKADADKIKDNLRNSSKIYYQITHSIEEKITE